MKLKFFDGLGLGLFLGATCVLLSLWFFNGLISISEDLRNSLIAQFVTIFAAALALWGVSAQIRSGEMRSESERLTKLDASKSILPLMLDSLGDECIGRAKSILTGSEEYALFHKEGLSEFQLSVLKDCIQHSSGLEKRVLQKTLVTYQILLGPVDV